MPCITSVPGRVAQTSHSLSGNGNLARQRYSYLQTILPGDRMPSAQHPLILIVSSPRHTGIRYSTFNRDPDPVKLLHRETEWVFRIVDRHNGFLLDRPLSAASSFSPLFDARHFSVQLWMELGLGTPA